ncbi:MAG: type II toxin-antitoxin system CcdA family antitoxin [Rhodocyclaceae bacterium]|nr:type II toxin-antitoxin system CcdA family antitoxin [Rhodocyclaceae bacterium]
MSAVPVRQYPLWVDTTNRPASADFSPFAALTRIDDAHRLRALLAREFAMSSTKKSANLSIRTDLLEEARAYKINLSQTLEAALQVELKKEKERRWLEENRAAIEAYNREIAEHGLWSDGLRLF